MKNLRIIILVLLSMGLVSCASSSNNSPEPVTDTSDSSQLATTTETTSTETASSTPAPGSPDEVICRREQLTGTNFRQRVCLTRAQRAQMRSGSRDEFIERRSATIGR